MTFSEELATLEQRTLDVQLEHFKIPPEERGRVFYALELMGETGELLNDCKKYIRTNVSHRRDSQSQSRIPEEAADTLVALFLYKLATGDRTQLEPQEVTFAPMSTAQLHECLSEIATDAAAFYHTEAQGNISGTTSPFDHARALAIIQSIQKIAFQFNFDISAVVHSKLTAIISKVQQGYYD